MAQKETAGEKPPFTVMGPMTDIHPTIGSPTSADAVKAADSALRPMMDNFRTYLDSMSASMPDASSVRASVEGMLPESMRGKGFGHEIAYIEDLALIVDRYRKEGNTEAAAAAERELKNAIEGFSGMVRGVAVLEAAGASPDTVSMFRNNFLNFVIGTSPEESEAYLALGRKGSSMVDFVADHMPAFKSDPAAWGRMEGEIFRFSSNPAGDPATVGARISGHDDFMTGMNQTVTNIEAAMAGGLSAQLAMFQNLIANLAQKATEEDVSGRLEALKKEIESLEKKGEGTEEEKEARKEMVDYLKEVEKALEKASKEDLPEMQQVAARCLAALSLAHDLAGMEKLVSKEGLPPEEAAARVMGVKKEEVKAFAENLRKMDALVKKKLTPEEAAMKVLGTKDAKDPRVKALVGGFNLLAQFRKAGATPAERGKYIESLREGARLQLFMLERFPAAGKLKKTISALSKDLSYGKTSFSKAISALAKSYSDLLDGFAGSIADKALKSKASAVAKMFLKPIHSVSDLEGFAAVVGLVGGIAAEEGKLKGKAKGAKEGALRIFGRALDIVLRGGPLDAAKTQFELGKMYGSCEDYELAGSIEGMSADIEDANAVWAMDYLISKGNSPLEAAMRTLSAKDKDDPRVKKLLSLFAKSGSVPEERSEYVKKKMAASKPQYLPLPKKALAKEPAAQKGKKEAQKPAPKAKASPKTAPKEKIELEAKITPIEKPAEASESLALSKEEKESLIETAKAVLAMPEAAGDKAVIEQGLDALASGKGTPEEKEAVAKMMAVLASRLGQALKKELGAKPMGANAKEAGEGAAASLAKPTPASLAKANTLVQMLSARRKILSGAKEPAMSEAAAFLDFGISYFAKTGDPSLMLSCAELATRYLSSPDQKELKEIISQAFALIGKGDAVNGAAFLDLARLYASAGKDDKGAILALARGAAANARLPGLAVFDDPARMKILVYKQKSESLAKIASPGAKVNATAYFDLALKAADAGRAGDAKLLLDLATSYSRDASIPDSALSDERRAERGRRMAWIEQNLGEYSGDKGMASGKRLLYAGAGGPGGWKPPDGAITAPFASAVMEGKSLAEAAGEGKRAEIKARLAKELGREPTKDETDSAVADYGRKELARISVKTAKDSADQAALEIKVKGDGIIGKDPESVKSKYSSEAKRLEAASKKAKTKGSADALSELAKLSDFDSVKETVGKTSALADNGADNVKKAIDIAAEAGDADEAELPLVKKRTDELCAGLPPEDKAELGKALALADDLEKAGRTEDAEKLRRAIYRDLLGWEAKRLMGDGARQLALSGSAMEALDGLHTSITKVDTLGREKGRIELGTAAKTCLALAYGFDVDEKGNPAVPPKTLSPERMESLYAQAGDSLALGKSLVDQQLAIKKRRDSGVWMENRLFTEDIGKAKTLLKDMAARLPQEAKESCLARIEEAKDDPAKLQAIYSELAKSLGVKTADERGASWLDLPGAGKKHSDVVSLYYSENFPAADSASEKNHAVFGIRFAGARMLFDEKMAKDGYAAIGTKVFGEGYRTLGNSDLFVIIGTIPDNNLRYAYEKELEGIPKGPEGAGARDALYAKLSKETVKVPGAGPYESPTIKDVLGKGKLFYFNTDVYSKKLTYISDLAEAGDLAGAKAQFKTLDEGMKKALKAEEFGYYTAAARYNQWEAYEGGKGVDEAFLDKAAPGEVDGSLSSTLRKERNKALKQPLDALRKSFDNSKKEWEGVASGTRDAVEKILSGDISDPSDSRLVSAKAGFDSAVKTDKERTAARAYASALIDMGKRFILKADVSEYGRKEKAEDFTALVKDYEAKSGSKLPFIKLEYDTATASREVGARCFEDAMGALENDSTFLTKLTGNEEIYAPVYEYKSGDIKFKDTGGYTYISAYSAVDGYGNRVKRKINFGKEGVDLSKMDMILTSSYMFSPAKDKTKGQLDGVGERAADVFFWKLGLQRKKGPGDSWAFDPLNLSGANKARLGKAIQNFEMLKDGLLIPTIEGYDISVGFGTKTLPGFGADTEGDFTVAVTNRMLAAGNSGALAIAGKGTESDIELMRSGVLSYDSKGALVDPDTATKDLKSKMGDISAGYGAAKAVAQFGGDMALGTLTGGAYFVVTGLKGVAETYEQYEKELVWKDEMTFKVVISGLTAVVPIFAKLPAISGFGEAVAAGGTGAKAYKAGMFVIEKGLYIGGAVDYEMQMFKTYKAYERGEMGLTGLLITGGSGFALSVAVPFVQTELSELSMARLEKGEIGYKPRWVQVAELVTRTGLGWKENAAHEAGAELHSLGAEVKSSKSLEDYSASIKKMNPLEAKYEISSLRDAIKELPASEKKALLDCETGYQKSKSAMPKEISPEQSAYIDARKNGLDPAKAYELSKSPGDKAKLVSLESAYEKSKAGGPGSPTAEFYAYSEARGEGLSPSEALEKSKSPEAKSAATTKAVVAKFGTELENAEKAKLDGFESEFQKGKTTSPDTQLRVYLEAREEGMTPLEAFEKSKSPEAKSAAIVDKLGKDLESGSLSPQKPYGLKLTGDRKTIELAKAIKGSHEEARAFVKKLKDADPRALDDLAKLPIDQASKDAILKEANRASKFEKRNKSIYDQSLSKAAGLLQDKLPAADFWGKAGAGEPTPQPPGPAKSAVATPKPGAELSSEGKKFKDAGEIMKFVTELNDPATAEAAKKRLEQIKAEDPGLAFAIEQINVKGKDESAKALEAEAGKALPILKKGGGSEGGAPAQPYASSKAQPAAAKPPSETTASPSPPPGTPGAGEGTAEIPKVILDAIQLVKNKGAGLTTEDMNAFADALAKSDSPLSIEQLQSLSDRLSAELGVPRVDLADWKVRDLHPVNDEDVADLMRVPENIRMADALRMTVEFASKAREASSVTLPGAKRVYIWRDGYAVMAADSEMAAANLADGVAESGSVAGILFSRKTLGGAYSKVVDLIESAQEYAASVDAPTHAAFSQKLSELIKARLATDPAFKDACDRALKSLVLQGAIEVDAGGKPVKQSILFVDTGFRTFPAFLKALVEVSYPGTVTAGTYYHTVAEGYEFLPHMHVQTGIDPAIFVHEALGASASFVAGGVVDEGGRITLAPPPPDKQPLILMDTILYHLLLNNMIKGGSR